MPVDANIALGIRPVEQVNMLGQMGQMMAIRQANDEYESSNALKDFYAQGGDLSKPEDQRRLMSTVGAKGADLIAKQFALQKTKEEVKKLGYDNVESEFKQSRGLLSSIDPDSPNAGPQLMAWHEANHRSPIMGSILAASGIDAASSRATLQASINRGPAGIREAIRRSSLGQADYQKELMQTERSVIAAGPANARLAQEQKERAEADLLFGRPTTTAPANAPMSGGGVPNALVQGSPSNMLLPGAQAPAATPVATPATATTPATASASAPAFAPMGDQFEQIKAINAEITRLRPYMSNPRVAANVQQLNAERTQLMASAEREYGGNLVDMSVEDPKRPGTYITVKGKLDQYGVAQPLKTGAMPRAVDITSGTSIDLPVARPAPRAGYQYNAKGEEVRIPQTGVPEGVRLKPDERWNETKQVVEQVPGSAAFIEQQRKHGADLGALKTTQATTKWGTGRIDKILAPENKDGFNSNFGGYNAYLTQNLTGNTATVKSELDSLKSDLKNKGLQMFRAGGSIGAMTEKEWPIIESMLATLTPKLDEQAARTILMEVRQKFEALENLAAEKYNDQWQGTQYHKPVDTSGGAGGNVPQAAIEMLKGDPKLSADFDAKYGAGASKRYLGK